MNFFKLIFQLANRAEMQDRKFELAELRRKDMDTYKKWINCADCWNSWMINPSYYSTIA